MAVKPIRINFAELRFRVEALHQRGWEWSRLTRSYTKRIRYDIYRHQHSLGYSQIKADFRDHEDYLDFLTYTDQKMVRELSDYIAEHSYFKLDD